MSSESEDSSVNELHKIYFNPKMTIINGLLII